MLHLPESTRVDKIIHKKFFDEYCNSSQKQLFSEFVHRITWMNKLSKETINLEGKLIQEIQTIKIDLKKKECIPKILNIIDQAMPYVLIFIVQYLDEFYISTSIKHSNPKKENNSIIDKTFQTDWYKNSEKTFELSLRNNLDIVYHTFCVHLSGYENLANLSFQEFVSTLEQIQKLENEIDSLKKSISSSKQFNDKVELNLLLNEKDKELKILTTNKIKKR
jgi:hypothetical protein